MNVEPRIARIPVVQKLLGGISKPKVYDLIKQGRLDLLHIDKSSFITLASVNALLAEAVAKGGAPRVGPIAMAKRHALA